MLLFYQMEVGIVEEKYISIAFSDSLKDEVIDSVSELTEVGLDSIMDEGLLKEVPLLSTAIAIYKIGHSIKDRHNLKKLAIFLDEINKSIVSEEKRMKYQRKFRENSNFRNREIEYILVLIDRYVSYDKPKMLAKLYMAYFDGEIVWEEMIMYAEIIDRFILLDYNTLISDSNRFVVHKNVGGEAILRLVALGLMTEVTSKSPFEEHSNGGIGMTWNSLLQFQTEDRVYQRTEFGDKLALILR